MQVNTFTSPDGNATASFTLRRCWPDARFVTALNVLEIAVPGVGEVAELAEHFSVRAEELRGIAANVKDPQLREAMLRWAADYDLFAKRALALATSGQSQK